MTLDNTKTLVITLVYTECFISYRGHRATKTQEARMMDRMTSAQNLYAAQSDPLLINTAMPGIFDHCSGACKSTGKVEYYFLIHSINQ